MKAYGVSRREQFELFRYNAKEFLEVTPAIPAAATSTTGRSVMGPEGRELSCFPFGWAIALAIIHQFGVWGHITLRFD